MSALRSSDLAGQRFGRLTAVERIGSDRHAKVLWLCKCDCGGSTEGISSDLRAGKLRSCGCSKRVAHVHVKDEAGNVYDQLTVLRWWGTNPRHRARWLCQCSCGKQTIVLGDYLRCRDTRSCGCKVKAWASHLGKTVGKYNQSEDNIKNFSTNAEYADAPCLIYFVEVGKTYDKIGITNNMKRRSNGAYTEIWYSAATNRATAWCVEQAALNLTAASAVQKPEPLSRFTYGHSELREGLAIDETIELLENLLEDATALGWQAFAKRYGLTR